jgi:flagellar biosynthetic protein FliR
MTITFDQLNGWIGYYFWPFMRVTGMLIVAPMFSTRTVPVQIRMMATLLITMVMAPVLPQMPLLDPFTLAGVLQIANQFMIGLAMGFVLSMIFAAYTVAAQAMGMSMGLGFAMAVDPNNGIQVPVLAQFYVLFATLIFMSINGHLLIIDTLRESFTVMPVGEHGLTRESIWSIVVWAKMIFIWGVKIALPIIVTLLLINVSFGVVTRAAPQLNIFAVGFPVSIMVGFWLVMVSLPTIYPRLVELMESAFSAVQGLRLVGG